MFHICLLSFIFTATTLLQATIIFLSSVHLASTQIPSDLFSILQDQVRSHHVISLFKMLQWLSMAFITLLKEASPSHILQPSLFSGRTCLRTLYTICQVLPCLFCQEPLPLALHTTSYPFLLSQPELSEVRVFISFLPLIPGLYNLWFFSCTRV